MDFRRLCGTAPRIKATKARLTAAGAEVLQPSNEWEVLRFRSKVGVGVVYKNKAGQLTANLPAIDAFGMLESPGKGGKGLLCPAPVRRVAKTSKARHHQLEAVMKRDGAECFYCTTPLALGAPVGDPRHPTREHLVPTNQGGPDNIANIFAACEPCNREAGHMSAPEKIAMRDRKRAAIRQWEAA
jgi:hypothetical protein